MTAKGVIAFFRRNSHSFLPMLLGLLMVAPWVVMYPELAENADSYPLEAGTPPADNKMPSSLKLSSHSIAAKRTTWSKCFWENFNFQVHGNQHFLDEGASNRINDFERMPFSSMARLRSSPLQSFTPLAPISIFSDAQFASSGFPGSGTSADPYHIEGYNITSTVGSLIQIHNTTVHFSIKGNWLNGLDQAVNAVELLNVTHGTVANNTMFQNAKDGIWLHSSTNNTIVNNRIFDNNQMGIAVRQSTHNTISSNSISSNNLIGLFVRDSEHNLVASNSVDNHTLSNIYLGGSAVNTTVRLNTCSDNYNGIVLNCADNNTVVSNNLYNHWGTGIYAEDSSNNFISENICAYNGGGVTITTSGEREINSSRNAVFGNFIYENTGHGILLDGCSRSSLSANRVHGNEASGIFLSETSLATITNSNIYDNGEHGILLDSCNMTTLFGNNAFDNDGAGLILSTSVNTTATLNNLHDNDNEGIWADYSHFNTFLKNAVFWNGATGMQIENSKANNITGNSFDSHQGGSGISLYFCQNHILSGNTVSNSNWYGIALENSDGNIISANTIQGNVGYGLLLGSWQGGASLTSDNNAVKFNDFSGNNQEFCQAFDGGLGNVFICNYWADWTLPDKDANSWVDSPYSIDSAGTNQSDPYPLATPSAHVLLPFTLTYPNGGETLSDNITIQWTASEDSLGHAIAYAVYCSVDKGELWKLIASNLTATSFAWDPRSSDIHGSQCLIKVTANCCEGLAAEDISDETFAMTYGTDSPSDPVPSLLVLVALVILGTGLGYFLVNAKLRKEPTFNDFFQSPQLDFLQSLYHKVIIALENIKLPPLAHAVGIPGGAVPEQVEGAHLGPPDDSFTVQRLDAIEEPSTSESRSVDEPLGVDHPDPADQTALATYFPPETIEISPPDLADPATLINCFPPTIRQDLKSGMKGRTVLALIEIAYQYPNEINPTKLSEILDIPATTISDEIKRLLKMQYIEASLSAKVLRDARYKYYSITQKGATFLHILKGTLNLAIQHLREMEHDVVM